MTDASHSDLLGEDLLGEYKPAPLDHDAARRAAFQRRPHAVVILPPNPTVDSHGEKYMKLYTQNKIRQAFHHLAMNNLDAVQTWLHTVAGDSPAKAVELFLELAKFSLPQLKETAVTVTQNNQTRSYSIAELEAELQKE